MSLGEINICLNGTNLSSIKEINALTYSSFTKIRPQAKMDNFAFNNSNIIIEGPI